MSKVLNYGRHCLDEADVEAVAAVLKGDFLTQGPTVERFEDAIAAYTGARYAVACTNGTAALHLACLAAGAAPGWKVATSTLSFVASANAAVYCGAEALLMDIDPNTLAVDAAALHRHLEHHPDTQIIIPVHMAGYAPAVENLRLAAGQRTIIEDACHAFGAQYPDGTPVGSCCQSDMTCFSFHPVKPFTTGEGGAVTTNDDELARRLRLLRNHGIERDPIRFVAEDACDDHGCLNPWHYEQQMLGYNYRLTDIQAALGLSQLGKIDKFIAKRRRIAERYDAAFATLPGLTTTQYALDMRCRSGHHLYVVRLDFRRLGRSRRDTMARLRARGVGTQVHYIPIHRQPFHQQRHGWTPADFPVAEAYYQECLSIPIHPGMSDEDVGIVIDTMTDLLNG